MRYRTIALIVIIGAPVISIATGLAGGLGLALSLVSAAISGTLAILAMALIGLARRRALKRYRDRG
jgi:hypothetical protein